ncbi:MAG: host attachment protein [Rhodocyclales bacterium]|nr:host attachment protein [Rhodocyclales bacterium]
MQTIWILAADAGRARIFETHGREKSLREIEDFVNPRARQHNHDTNAGPRVDPIRHEMVLFAKNVSLYLEKARNEHRYDRLCVIAAPKVLGLIRQNLSKEAMKRVDEEIVKDISRFDQRDIEHYLEQYRIRH